MSWPRPKGCTVSRCPGGAELEAEVVPLLTRIMRLEPCVLSRQLPDAIAARSRSATCSQPFAPVRQSVRCDLEPGHRGRIEGLSSGVIVAVAEHGAADTIAIADDGRLSEAGAIAAP